MLCFYVCNVLMFAAFLGWSHNSFQAPVFCIASTGLKPEGCSTLPSIRLRASRTCTSVTSIILSLVRRCQVSLVLSAIYDTQFCLRAVCNASTHTSMPIRCLSAYLLCSVASAPTSSTPTTNGSHNYRADVEKATECFWLVQRPHLLWLCFTI